MLLLQQSPIKTLWHRGILSTAESGQQHKIDCSVQKSAASESPDLCRVCLRPVHTLEDDLQLWAQDGFVHFDHALLQICRYCSAHGRLPALPCLPGEVIPLGRMQRLSMGRLSPFHLCCAVWSSQEPCWLVTDIVYGTALLLKDDFVTPLDLGRDCCLGSSGHDMVVH